MRKFRLVLILLVTTAILMTSLIAVYLLVTRRNYPTIAVVEPAGVKQTSQTPAGSADGAENPLLPPTNTTNTVETPVIHALEILLRLFLAVVLAAILAFRPRKN